MDTSSEEQYTLLVALGNPDTSEQLLRTATDIAADRDGRLHLLSVAHKPVHSPFRLFSDERITADFSGDRSTMLERAADGIDAVPVTTELKSGTDIASVIASVVQDVDADALLLGWRDRPRPSDVVLGTTVDPLLRSAPCPVLLERADRTAGSVDQILLPTVGGIHAAMTGSVAASIARRNDASVTVLAVVPHEASDERQERATASVAAMAETLAELPVERQLRTTEDIGGALVSAADDHDLVILGATRTGRLVPRTIGSVARRVADGTDQPVLIAKDTEEQSRLGSLLGRVVPTGF